MLEKYPMEKALSGKMLGAYKYNGFWHCVDSKRDLEKFKDFLNNKKLSFE